MIPVYWHYGGRGSWCHTLPEFLFNGYEHHIGIQPADRAIVVVKADSVPSVQQLNHDLAQIGRGVLLVTGNEEGTFPVDKLTPHMKVWLQTPAKNQIASRYIPWGWTPKVEGLPTEWKSTFCWSFAGQNSHIRRHQCIEALKKCREKGILGLLVETAGFSQGLSRSAYWELLHASKLIPCPSGPLTLDTFRVAESLEAGAIPILDCVSPIGHYRAYWTRVFGENFPMPVIESWDTLPALMDVWLDGWEGRAEVVGAWWRAKKQEWLYNLAADIA